MRECVFAPAIAREEVNAGVADESDADLLWLAAVVLAMAINGAGKFLRWGVFVPEEVIPGEVVA